MLIFGQMNESAMQNINILDNYIVPNVENPERDDLETSCLYIYQCTCFSVIFFFLICSINMLIPPQKTVFEVEEEEEKALEIQRWQERRRRASLETRTK